MADTAVLDGIGAALTAFGGVYGDFKKTELANKLRQEEEIAKEERVQKRKEFTPDPSQTEYRMNNEGVWQEHIRSGTGRVLETRLAPANKVKEFELQTQKDKIGLDKILLDIEGKKLDNTTAQMELDALPDELSLDRRYKESQISRNQDTGLAAMMRARDATEDKKGDVYTPSPSEISNALLKDYETITKELKITDADAKRVADAVALELIQRAKSGDPRDPGTTMKAALTEFKNAGTKTGRYK